jgi:hypothetical protein
MAFEILEGIIDGRNVEELKCSEAAKIVSEFYEKLSVMTLGATCTQTIEYFANKALKRAGLEFFA